MRSTDGGWVSREAGLLPAKLAASTNLARIASIVKGTNGAAIRHFCLKPARQASRLPDSSSIDHCKVEVFAVSHAKSQTIANVIGLELLLMVLPKHLNDVDLGLERERLRVGMR